MIPERPPTIADIGLPPHLAEIADYHQGLVIVCGPSGSGKSTTLAALVNLFNETRHDHVITLEDPVEFVHPFKSCLVNQREVGSHTQSFARALRAALREDPDVIVIGELRDNESVSLALTAAETGHIVLGTLNSTSAAKAVDRVLSSFPVDGAGPGARVAQRVAEVRDRAAAAARPEAAHAGRLLRGAAQHAGDRQHDPRREDLPDPLGDADRPHARACRPSTTGCACCSPASASRSRPPVARP